MNDVGNRQRDEHPYIASATRAGHGLLVGVAVRVWSGRWVEGEWGKERKMQKRENYQEAVPIGAMPAPPPTSSGSISVVLTALRDNKME